MHIPDSTKESIRAAQIEMSAKALATCRQVPTNTSYERKLRMTSAGIMAAAIDAGLAWGREHPEEFEDMVVAKNICVGPPRKAIL